VQIGAVSYRIPFYELDASLDAIVGYSSVNTGTVGTSVGNFAISGSGNVYELHYNQNLKKVGDWDQKISLGFSYRVFKTNVVVVNTTQNLVPPLTIHPFDLTYTISKFKEPYIINGYVSLVQNLPFGTHGESDDFNQFGARPGSRASYFLTRYGLDYSYIFKNGWQGRLKFSGQITQDMLIPGEQFGFGGQESVRGLDERSFSNDEGYQITAEAYTPEFGKYLTDTIKFLPDTFKIRALAFYDTGNVKRNHPAVFESQGAHVTSMGLGFRAALSEDMNFRMDYARINNPPDGLGRHSKIHAQFAWTF